MKMTLLQHLNHICSRLLQLFFTPLTRSPVYLPRLVYQLTNYFPYELKLNLLLVVDLLYHHLIVYFDLHKIFWPSLCVILYLVEIQPLLSVHLVKSVNQPSCLLYSNKLDQRVTDLLRQFHVPFSYDHFVTFLLKIFL